MKKHVSEWHRVGVSINSIGKSKQNLCSASPEITNLLRKEIKAYKSQQVEDCQEPSPEPYVDEEAPTLGEPEPEPQ